MGVILGTGDYTYRVCETWAKLPPEMVLGDVAAVGVDSKDRVYVFNRSARPMLVFDRDGNFLKSWGEGIFKHPHGVSMGPDDTIYCTDDHDHTVRKCTLDGKVLIEIGIPNKPQPFMSGRPFNRCTHTALSPIGDIYITDGYSNACVHKYSGNGKHLMSWGKSGRGPGEFNLPHNVTCDADGYVYVADRVKSPHSGVRWQRQISGRVDQHPSAQRLVHAAGQMSDLLRRRDRTLFQFQPRRAQSGTAGLRTRQQG